MNEQVIEKNIGKWSQTIVRWSGPLIYLLSYGLILGFASAGLGLMACSMGIGLLFGAGLYSSIGFLTGGLIFTAGGTLVLWKLTRELEGLCSSSSKKPKAS